MPDQKPLSSQSTTDECPSCRLSDGRHRARCPRLPEYLSDRPACDVMRGDGSIPQPTCILPQGHYGAHYG